MVLNAEAGRILSYKGKRNMYTTGHSNTPTDRSDKGTVDDVVSDDVVSEEEVGLQKRIRSTKRSKKESVKPAWSTSMVTRKKKNINVLFGKQGTLGGELGKLPFGTFGMAHTKRPVLLTVRVEIVHTHAQRP